MIQKEAYIAWTNRDDLRLNSSSGAIFPLLAEQVIFQDGIVVGAAWCSGFNVKHIIISTTEEIRKLQGSKYVQSDVQHIYKHVQEFLKKDKPVLFTGTPCQCEGLKSFLGCNYDRLYTMDFICHGVPSPLVFKAYLNEQESFQNAKCNKVNFRNKKVGWKKFGVSLTFDNQKEYWCEFGNDLYGKSFNENLFIRPSCYECKFKGYNRRTDLTVADMWGIERFIKDDDKGASFVMPNTNKGWKMLELIKNDIILSEPYSCDELTWNNMYVVKSGTRPKYRNKTFKYLKKHGFRKSVYHYTHKNFMKKLLNKMIIYLLKYKHGKKE